MLPLIIRDMLLFGILGIILGLLVDFVFVDPTPDENLMEAIFYLLLQIVICGIIIYYLAKGYQRIFGTEPDLYYGLTMFEIIFFLVQVQLFERISILFHRFVGHPLPNGL